MSSQLPTGWTSESFETLFHPLQYGLTASADRAPDALGPKFLRITDIVGHQVDWGSVPTCDVEDEDITRFRLANNDIVFARTGSIEKTWRVRKCPKDAVFASYLIRGRLRDARRAPWVEYYLRSQGYLSQVYSVAAGIGRANINATSITRFTIPLCPLPEQERIVAAVETQLTRIAATTASLERVKANLKRARASVLKAAVEGRLVPTEASLARSEGRDYEHASVLLTKILTDRRARWAENGEKSKYKDPTKPQDLSELGHHPEGWTWVTLEQISSRIVDCLHSTPKFVKTGHACLDTNAMGAGVFRLDDLRYVDQATFNERNRRLVPRAGDIVFAREGTVGNAVVLGNLEVCLGQRTMLIRPSHTDPRLVMHWMMSPFVRAQYAPLISGSTVAHLNMADIRRFILPFPPLAEQHRIVAEVDRRLSVLDAIELAINADLARCARLRQSMLKRAFEGRLVPPEPSMTGKPPPQDAVR